MMNCIIIDDEETARLILQQLIENNSSLNLKASFSNAIEAIKYLNKNSDIDLIFLDIHMPGFTGFDLIETLKHPPQIILTTSDRNFALEAFEYQMVVDYLLKPITNERFNKALLKLNMQTTSKETISKKPEPSDINENEMFINVSRRLVKIEIPSIKLVEAKGDYVLIKTIDKNYTLHSTLKKIEEKLPSRLFLKIHRSFIINVKMIIDIEDNSVLIDKDVIPISRSKKSELMERLNLL